MDVARRDSGVELPVTRLDLVAEASFRLDLVAVDDPQRRVLVEVEPARVFFRDRGGGWRAASDDGAPQPWQCGTEDAVPLAMAEGEPAPLCSQRVCSG